MDNNSDRLTINATLHWKVQIVKYDGTNKEDIVRRLKIKSHIPVYFEKAPSYFVIPCSNHDWFILDEDQFKNLVTVDEIITTI